MGSTKFYATVAGMIAIAAASSARAADLLPPPPPPPPFEAPVEFGGWYLRGDVGVSHYEGASIKNPTATGVTYYGDDYGAGAFAGVGVGYQFNSWFRADITGEYRFSTGLRVRDRGSFTAGGFGVTGYEDTKGDFSSAVGLINGYFDLGTWYGVTPFIGAGVGWAQHYLHGFGTSTINVYGPPINVTGVSGGDIRDHDSGSFAWALHAGLGYDVSPNLKLEVAYRYLNLGDAKTGVVDCYCGQTYAGFKVRDLESHDVKIGMRWMLGGPAVVPMPEPYGAPIVRKY